MGGQPFKGEEFEANRAAWQEMTTIHLDSEFYDAAGFLAGKSTLHDFEPGELGPVEGFTLLHLQCHFGLDSMSWSRHGALVTGLDFSSCAIAAANAISEEAGLDATFVEGNVYDAPRLIGEQFDIVYTGLGALNWLPDVPRWASVVSAMLKPGGRFYLLEFHPILSMLADDAIAFNPEWTYFHDPQGIVCDDDRDYADATVRLSRSRTYEWSHHLGEVVSSLLDEGLELRFLHEHPVLAYRPWPFLEQIEPGVQRYRIPQGLPQVPLEYSLLAVKPQSGS